jgi:hypothetical protein
VRLVMGYYGMEWEGIEWEGMGHDVMFWNVI